MINSFIEDIWRNRFTDIDMPKKKNSKTCFIASPIGSPDSDERKNSDEVLEYILSPVLKECGYSEIRADEINISGSITVQVLQALNDSDIVIADLTGANPNVMYEVGIRHATQKPFIHIVKKGISLPFDVNDLRAISYDLHISDVNDAKKRLKEQIKSIEDGNWIPSALVTFSIPQGTEEGNERILLNNINQTSNQISQNILELQESIKTVVNIVADMHNTRAQDREDRNAQMAMQFLGPMLTTAMQNPEALQTLIDLGNQEN